MAKKIKKEKQEGGSFIISKSEIKELYEFSILKEFAKEDDFKIIISTSNGIGQAVIVECVNKNKNITDYDRW
jgi:hypothetical protein